MKRTILFLAAFLLLAGSSSAQDHFAPVEGTGLPYAVVVQNATFNGSPLGTGDEIGVFDGELCVGAAVLDGGWPVSITAWQGDPNQGLEGFTSGNPMSFRLWVGASGTDIEAEATYLTGDGTFGYGFGTNISTLEATQTGAPDIFLPETAYDFGTVPLDGSAEWSFSIQNIGDQLLSIQDVSSDIAAFTVGALTQTDINPSASVEVPVTFTPDAVAPFSGQITITSNDPDEGSVVVTLTGEGIEAGGPHFQAVAPTGLPYAIVVQQATFNDAGLVNGDEIAVFDGDLCVGAVVLDGAWPISITAWQGDPSQGLDGFTNGNTIQFRLWVAGEGLDLEAAPTYATGDGTFGFGFGTNVSLLTAITAGPPVIQPNASTHVFGTVTVGTFRAWTLEVTNAGESTLEISSIASNNPVFTTMELGETLYLEPTQVANIPVWFTPTAAEPSSGTLTLTSNDPATSTLEIALGGTGGAMPDHHFDSVAPTGSSYPVQIDLARIEGVALATGDEIALFDGELCVGVASVDGVWPMRIAAWEENPGSELPGYVAGNTMLFRIHDSSADQDYIAEPVYGQGNGTFADGDIAVVSMLDSGDALLPELSIEVDQHDFGPVLIGETADWVVTLENGGTAPLEISSIESGHADFTVDLTGPFSIPAGELQNVTITFGPNVADAYAAAITIHSNDPDSPDYAISVSGQGIAPGTPDIEVDVTEYDFGNVLVGESASWSMGIHNLGDGSLEVTSVSVDLDTFDVAGFEPGFLAPDSTMWVEVSFNPVEIGGANGFLTILSNDPDEGEVVVSLYGTGVSLPGDFSLVWPSDESTLTALPIDFLWTSALNEDVVDTVTYQLEIAGDMEFTDPLVFDAGEDTSISVESLPDDSLLYWRVRALDTNTEGRLSAETWSFTTNLPSPPGPFHLLTPPDSSIITYEPPVEVTFSWTPSIDPDAGQEVLYTFWFSLQLTDTTDTTLGLPGLADTLYTVNIPDSLGLADWADTLSVTWWVEAISPDGSITSDESWTLYFEPALGVDEDFASQPRTFGISALYPNPFNPTATVVVAMPNAADLRLEVFNLLGQRVALLSRGFCAEGQHRFTLDGRSLASGVYFVRASIPGVQVAQQKVVLMR